MTARPLAAFTLAPRAPATVSSVTSRKIWCGRAPRSLVDHVVERLEIAYPPDGALARYERGKGVLLRGALTSAGGKRLHKAIRPVSVGRRDTFSDLGATVAEWLGISFRGRGRSFLSAVVA